MSNNRIQLGSANELEIMIKINRDICLKNYNHSMKKLSILVFFLLFMYSLCPADEPVEIPTDSAKPEIITIMLADVKFGSGTSEVSISKIEAAIALTAKISGKYELIHNSTRDSIARLMHVDSLETTIIAIARKLNADKVLFIKVNQIKNMLRIDIISGKTGDSASFYQGTGYSLLHYRKEKDNKAVYDPTLLQAVQRAFAVAEKDSMMFAGLEGSFQVYPAKTLAIGGLDFKNDSDLPEWDLFVKKEVYSFDASESIFEQAKESPYYAVYDLDSRDSIYALFNLFGVENFNAPTTHEIEALHALEIDSYITGKFIRVQNGAEIEIHLCDMQNKNFRIMESEKSILESDDLEKMRKLVKDMTEKLLEKQK